MNTNNEKIIDTEEVQDAAEQHRHPVLAVRNLLPSIIKEDGEEKISKEMLVATAGVVILVAALVVLYIYGATIV